MLRVIGITCMCYRMGLWNYGHPTLLCVPYIVILQVMRGNVYVSTEEFI